MGFYEIVSPLLYLLCLYTEYKAFKNGTDKISGAIGGFPNELVLKIQFLWGSFVPWKQMLCFYRDFDSFRAI